MTIPPNLDGRDGGETTLRTLVRDPVRLAYHETGSGSPPLVFLHGWGGNHGHFEHVSAHFADRHQVLAPDLRGFGGSDQPSSGYEVEELADDLLWMCERRGIEDAVLIGHSLGGAVALAAASRRPRLARALVLCEPAIFFPSPALKRIDTLIADPASPRCHAAACAYATRFTFLEQDDESVRDAVLAELRTCSPHVLHAVFAGLRAFDAEPCASRLRSPVLMIDGARPFVESDRFRRCCPQLQVAATPEVGHYQPLLAPQAVSERITEFLAGLGD